MQSIKEVDFLMPVGDDFLLEYNCWYNLPPAFCLLALLVLAGLLVLQEYSLCSLGHSRGGWAAGSVAGAVGE